jgi:two-component system, OmpR family, alkaline phosphatase synthesis response regulator PhoP
LQCTNSYHHNMKQENFKILIVDDEADILEFISFNLKREGFTVCTATEGKSAIEIAKDTLPNLILLDIMMPGIDGIETCEILRSVPELNNTLIAFLTARGEDYSQIAGFEAGGDDYIVKPIKPKVLISRIYALLKRLKREVLPIQNKSNPLEVGDLLIDPEKYVVYKGGKELWLPKKQFELLLLLSSKPGRVFTRDEIFRSIWDDNVIVGDRTIDVHIRKLREKIGEDLIRTIKGIGYKFNE